MLDAWIIDLIKKQEKARQQREEEARPRLELPLPPPYIPREKPPERGVVVIDL